MKTAAITLWAGLAALTTLAPITTQAGDGSAAQASIALFNGRNLDAWRAVLAEPALKKEDVWSVKDGIIICKGTPFGFIDTGENCLNFRLVVEYRWPTGAKPGNSGIFSRVNDRSKALPRCVETQLRHGNAGDVLGLQGMPVQADQPRFFAIKKHALAGGINGVRKLVDAENPPGEWNRVEILAEGPNYTVWVNGKKVNEAHGIATIPGKIGLQSEGGEIHFRRVILTPLP